jgi:hypothetical protein
MAEKKEKSGEYSALQDWMCSIGEPASSIIVSAVLGVLVVAVALIMKAVL